MTEFPQIRAMTAEAYARLAAMKLYRSATGTDRRYLLFNAIEKMTVTREGEKIITLLSDTIAARAFESDMYFGMALLGVTGLPRLEGTVHVNMALSLKFMPNYMFRPANGGLAALQALPLQHAPAPLVHALAGALHRAGAAVIPLVKGAPALPPVGRRRDAANDDFLFAQGPSSGLGRVSFAGWRPVLAEFAHIPNVGVFAKQAEAFQTLLATATPTAEQQRDVDFLFSIGELFTLLPYAQLICEQARIEGTDPDLLDHIFEVLVTDFSTHATRLHCKASASTAQRARALDLIRQPVADPARFDRVVTAARNLAGGYQMAP